MKDLSRIIRRPPKGDMKQFARNLRLPDIAKSADPLPNNERYQARRALLLCS
jgi:hypothetical protein